MRKEELVETVLQGKFHSWAVRTVDKGIKILTSIRAGRKKEDGTFEAG
jgi:hypothetical protein